MILCQMTKQTKCSKKTDGNIRGVDWKAEIKEPVAHMPQLNNNQYVALEGEEDNKDNDTKIIGVESDGKITGVRNDKKFTEVDSNNKSTKIRKHRRN